MKLNNQIFNIIIIVIISTFLFVSFWINSFPVTRVGEIRSIDESYKATFALNKTEILEHYQFYRLITAGFVHDSFLSHLFGNLLSFITLGIFLRKNLSPKAFILLIFGTVIIVNILLMISDNSLDKDTGRGFSAVPWALLGASIALIRRVKITGKDAVFYFLLIIPWLILILKSDTSLYPLPLYYPLAFLALFVYQHIKAADKTIILTFKLLIIIFLLIFAMGFFLINLDNLKNSAHRLGFIFGFSSVLIFVIYYKNIVNFKI